MARSYEQYLYHNPDGMLARGKRKNACGRPESGRVRTIVVRSLGCQHLCEENHGYIAAHNNPDLQLATQAPGQGRWYCQVNWPELREFGPAVFGCSCYRQSSIQFWPTSQYLSDGRNLGWLVLQRPVDWCSDDLCLGIRVSEPRNTTAPIHPSEVWKSTLVCVARVCRSRRDITCAINSYQKISWH